MEVGKAEGRQGIEGCIGPSDTGCGISTATSVPSALERSDCFGSHRFFIVVALYVPCITRDDGLNLSYRPCCALVGPRLMLRNRFAHLP